MHPADHFGTCGGAVEVAVEVPAHIAEVIEETGRALIPGAEDEAVMALDTGHLQRAPLALVDFVTIAVRLVRNGNQVAREIVAPAVIRAGERARIAAIGAADPHPAMTALVEECANRAVLLADYEDRIFRHIGGKKVSGFFELALMTEIEPRAREDAFQLQLVDGSILIDARIEVAALLVDHRAQAF